MLIFQYQDACPLSRDDEIEAVIFWIQPAFWLAVIGDLFTVMAGLETQKLRYLYGTRSRDWQDLPVFNP